ncbi:hypothetical protein Lnau_0048 [Legionella nautarum]|uniref:Uncharacterized protein n=1 Tax=Legionella nautarum TaxID=45070 RepID=A0A0W0X3Z5_9GAMM|nr:hypothetical protein Lnau_0048 [Legionella nautarum]
MKKERLDTANKPWYVGMRTGICHNAGQAAGVGNDVIKIQRQNQGPSPDTTSLTCTTNCQRINL